MNNSKQLAFGYVAVTAAILAVASCTYRRALPYRLTQAQADLLVGAFSMHLITSVLAVLAGIAAVLITRHHQSILARRLGVAAIILGALSAFLAIAIPDIHSNAYPERPNHAVEPTRAPEGARGSP